ncbi:MAG: ABC transporter permease [Gemmatimonadaceae bacterium]
MVARLLSSLAFAWRSLVARPTFSIIVVACLALGIAVNTTVFAVFDAVLWRPYDFVQPDRLAVLKLRDPRDGDESGLAVAALQDIRRESRSFSGVGGIVSRSVTITDGDEPERLEGAWVSWDLFPILGTRPQLGRNFRQDEDAGAPPTVVLLSDDLWQRRFARDSSVLNSVMQINGQPHTVIGIMPRGFKFPETAELWVPFGDMGRADPRTARYVSAYGRLRDGITHDEASREFAALAGRLEQEHGLAEQGWAGTLVDLRTEFIPDDVRLVVLAMMGAVTFVLLIAVANVANLTLARTSARQREIAIRSALGAGRGRIVRQLVFEAIVMALIAGLVSVPLAKLGLSLVDRGMPAGDEVPYYIQWSIDHRVALYTVGISILVGIAFGLLPALQATSGDLQGALRDGGRGSSTGARRNRTRATLVVAEVALALVLLVGASLFVRSFASMEREQVGLDTSRITTLRYYLQGTEYDSAFKRQQRIEDIVRRVEALPGVESATASNLIPLDGGGRWSRVESEGRAFREEDAPWIWWSGVTAHWSRTLGLTLTAGRDLTESEAIGANPVAVIDQQLATSAWPNQDPLGRRFRMAGDTTLPWFTVVGVVRHYRQGQLGDRGEDPASVYVPLYYSVPRTAGLLVRTTGDPAGMNAPVRAAIRAADPVLPVFEVMTLDQVRRLGFWQYGLFGWMFGVFGVVALFLAAIGVYGVISYGVAQRTQEFGVRLALGAQRSDVLRMVVRHGLALAGTGIVVGLLGALGVTRVVGSLLVNVTPTDPVSFVGVSTFLALIAVVACVIPARRATSVDPIIALRSE